MAIKRPDIYEHNNPNNAFVDSDFVRGGFRTSVANLTALYALSGKTDQLKAHSTVVYVSGVTKYYILKDIGNVGNSNGWEEFVTGSGSTGGTVTGATNGLTVSSKNVKLGGDLCEGTTIYTCGNGLYFAASPALNSYVQTCLSNTFGQNTYQVLFNDTGSTKSNHLCVSSTSGELYFACDSNNCSSLYGDISKLCLTNKTAGASKTVILDGNALNYANNYASSFVARSLPDVAWVTACTSNYLGDYYTKSQINYYTGTTVPNVYVTKSAINYYTGTTVPNVYVTKSAINYYTGTTVPNVYVTKSAINYYTGTTVPANYYNKTQINQYTGSTNNRITSIETKYISGATNGLTKVGKLVKLGGTLTGNTTISGNYSFSVYNSAGSFGPKAGFCFNPSTGSGCLTAASAYESTVCLSSNYLKLSYCDPYSAGLNSPCHTIQMDNNGIDIRARDDGSGGGTTYLSVMNLYQCELGLCGTHAGWKGICLRDLSLSTQIASAGSYVATKCYVDYKTSGGTGVQIVTGATNGLTKVNKDIKLGGNLTGITTINTCNNSFYIQSDTTSGFAFADFSFCDTNYAGSQFVVKARCNTGSACWNLENTGTRSRLLHQADSSNNSLIDVCNACIVLTNNTAGIAKTVKLGTNALQYAADYTSCYACLSIPHVGYVTGLTSVIESGLAWCWNGTNITNCGRNINNENSGGNFSWYGGNNFNWGDSTYYGSGFCVTSNNICIKNVYEGVTMNGNGVFNYTTDLSPYFTARSLVDAAYVTGKTTTSGIHFACNGITKVGQTVILGGQLTGDACIYTTNVANCTYLNFDRTNNSISTYTKGGNISLCSVPNTGVGGKICITAVSGMTYAADYSVNYTNRTIVDKEYVDKKMSIINVNNNNGVCPFYIGVTDNFVGVSGYTVGNCACLYLVSTPAVGQKIIIADIQGQALDYPISIDGNGKCINGNGAAMINTDYGSTTFVYNGYFWSAVAFVN